MNLKEALKLYDLLGEYLPEGDELTIEFVGTIVHSIREDGSPAFVNALCLMMDKDEEEIVEFEPEFLSQAFFTGLMINGILNLREFCRKIGYG